MQGGTFRCPFPEHAHTVDCESPARCIDLNSDSSDDPQICTMESQAFVFPACLPEWECVNPFSVSSSPRSPHASPSCMSHSDSFSLYEIAQPIPGLMTPTDTAVLGLDCKASDVGSATKNSEVDSEQLPPLPCQLSIKFSPSATPPAWPQSKPTEVSPTIPFSLDLPIPARARYRLATSDLFA